MSPTLLTNGLQSYQHGGSVEEQSKYTNKAVGETSNEYVLNVAFWTFILFTIAEAFFAVIAGSQSMLEDAEAMAVDALTYFFNLWAEKVKHRPLSEREERMLPVVRQHHKERTRLYMELIPPLISVFTLLVVTVNALQDAFESLRTPENNEEDVNVIVMMTFSALNMLLDIVNVACFAKAHQAFGLSEVRKEPFSNSTRNTHHSAEFESMLSPKDGQSLHSTSADGDEIDEKMSVNLNMCSAWTHVCADTLRSAAVLIAASIAFFFESVSGAVADSMAAVVVSIIILLSLLPLIHGLYITARKIIALKAEAPTLDV